MRTRLLVLLVSFCVQTLSAASVSASEGDATRAKLAAAENSLRLHDVRRAKEWLSAVPAPERAFEWRWLNQQSQQFLRSFEAHKGRINGLSVSPDGKWLLSTGADQKALLWSLPALNQPREIDAHSAAVWHSAWSPDSQRFATVGSDGRLRVSDLQGQAIWTQEKIGQGMGSVAWHPDGNELVTSNWRSSRERGVWGVLQWWRASDGQLLRSVEHGVKPLVKVAFTQDGRSLLVGDWDDQVSIFSQADGQLLRTLKPAADPHYKAVQSLAISPDDQQVLVVGKDGSTRNWSLKTGELLRTDFYQAEGDRRWLNDVRWLDQQHWITGGNDGSLRLWSTQQVDKPLATWHGALAGISALAAHGNLIFSADNSGHIQIWDRQALMAQTAWTFGEALYDLAFSPKGDQLAVTGWKGGMQILRSADGASVKAISAHDISGVRADWSRDGLWLASTGNDKRIRLWRASDLQAVKTLRELESGRSNAIAFSPDSQQLAAATLTAEVQIWRVSDQQLVRGVALEKSSVSDLRWTPSGEHLLAAGSDGVSWIIAHSPESTASPVAPPLALRAPKPATAIQFLPIQNAVLTAHSDGSLRRWSMQGELLEAVPAQMERINTLALSADGRRLAVGGEDGVVSILDAATLKLLIQPRFPASVWQLKFSPDGQTLFVMALDKRIYRLQAR